MVYGRLGMAITMNRNLNTVSAMQIGVIWEAGGAALGLLSLMIGLLLDIAVIVIVFYQYTNVHTQIIPNPTPMHAFQSLRCYICSSPLADFVVLSCNHTVCGQCLSSHYESDSYLLTVPCPCGLTTNIPTNHNKRDSSSTNLKTCHSLPSFKANQNQILDQSQFVIKDISTAGGSRVNQKCTINRELNQRRNTIGYKSATNYLMNQLVNQIKFMELRFKRYLNQINRHYGRLIIELNKKHTQLTKQIMNKCKAKIQNRVIQNLASIQQHIQKVFKSELEGKLIKISKFLSNCKNSFDVDYVRKSIVKTEQQNANKQNTKRKNSLNKIQKQSTHENCKRQEWFTNLIKEKSIKGTKLLKKRLKNKLSTVYM